MITIAANSEATREERIEKAFFIVESSAAQLAEISRLLDAGELKCFVDTVVPLNEASDAYRGRPEERKGRGKIVLSMEKQPARRVCEEWRFGPLRNINRTRPRRLSLLTIVLVLVLDRRPNPTANPWSENTHDKQERAAISVEDEFEFEDD